MQRIKYAPAAGIGLATALFLFSALAPAISAPSKPPVAPVKPVTNTYFGHKVVDPYQWMENSDSTQFQTWLRGQANYARAVLDNIPGRDKLYGEIKKLDNASTSVGEVQIGGGRYFYLKTEPGFDTAKLFVRDGLNGKERLLFDPQTLSENGVPYVVDYYAASWDGKYVAYGISPGGSENSVIHVMDVDTGKALPETIDRARFGGVAWRMDNHSFFYNRLPKLAANAPPTAAEEESVDYLHVLGTSVESDKPIFGYEISSKTPMSPADTPFVMTIAHCPYIFGMIEHGVQNEVTAYAAPADEVNSAATPWRKIVDISDDVTGFDAHGSTLYLLTHKDASRYKVVSLDLSQPGARFVTFVPQGQAVIKGIGAAQDALYIQDLDGGIGRIRKVPFTGGPAQLLNLPYQGAVPSIVTYANRPGVVFMETGWTHSALWYSYDPSTGRIADTRLKPLSPVSFADMTSVEVKARSADGTLVPLSIVYKKGIRLDGSHPTILQGYGAYGITLDPYFDPTTRPWLERGGVLAYAHVRGGGEYGEDWHRAGMKLEKYHSIDDFIACARYLIAKGYTSPARLASDGASAGGIVVGMSLVEHPELFRAAVDEVGVSDALRSELEPNGPPNIPEFGSFTTPDGFKALYNMDAYLHVKKGVPYPAVFLATGANDPRVAPWEPAKMTARLQAATSSGRPVILRVDYEAGHGADTKSQEDSLLADEYAFLFWQMGVPGFQPAQKK